MQGHETWPFTQLFKEKLEEARNPYHNETLQGACLFRYVIIRSETFAILYPQNVLAEVENDS